MADSAMDTYLNDHLGGSVLGADLARHIASQAEGRRADTLTKVAAEIAEDVATLEDLLGRMGTTRNPAKAALAWLGEKASWVKFSGLSAFDRDHGLFMALESLSLGIEGKASLWRALAEVRDRYAPLQATDLDDLIARAETQRKAVDAERLLLGREMFTGDAAA